MIAKPVEGRLVRDPITMLKLPADGIPVGVDDLFWARAAMAGDVTLEADPAPAGAPDPAPTPAPTSAEPAASSADEPAESATEEAH